MIKTPLAFYTLLRKAFPYEATQLQDKLLRRFTEFVFAPDPKGLFSLKGYAGTGKTTAISVIVNELWHAGKKAVLLAPTGRAAKVIASYSGREAFTIHKKIYHPKNVKGGGVNFVLKKNRHTRTLFFVDEASMISDNKEGITFGNTSLLQDLINYVYSGKDCKLVLIGDTAQLPPVKLLLSPALDINKLTFNYHKNVTEIELTEVMRQQERSGVLINATKLRNQLARGENFMFQFQMGYKDLIHLEDGYEIQEAIQDSYDREGMEDTTIIVRSNKRANQYNQQIRHSIIGLENDIATGDIVMVVKNNYYWLDDSSKAGFIANGDTCEVLAIHQRKELYGFHFAEVTIRMIDYPKQKPIEVILLLDTLQINTASLSFEDGNRLYQEIAKDYAHLRSKYKIVERIKNNKYYNALQVKFSYAVTCHKSQGGQWKNVFIEKPWLPKGQNTDYWRWLYTALTRAQKKVYLIGYTSDDFRK